MEEDRGDTGWMKDRYNELHDPCTKRHEAGLTINGCGNIYRDRSSQYLAFLFCITRVDYEEAAGKECLSRAIIGEARTGRASLGWWSQRDLNPCFNPITISPYFTLD